MRQLAVLVVCCALIGCAQKPQVPPAVTHAHERVMESAMAVANARYVERARAIAESDAMKVEGEEVCSIALGRDFRSVLQLSWLSDETLLVISRYPGGSSTRSFKFATVSVPEQRLTPIGEVGGSEVGWGFHVGVSGTDQRAWCSFFNTYPHAALQGTVEVDIPSHTATVCEPPADLREVPLFADKGQYGEKPVLAKIPRLRILDGLSQEIASGGVPDDLFVWSALFQPRRAPDGSIVAALTTGTSPDVEYMDDQPVTDVSLLRFDGEGNWDVVRTLHPTGPGDIPSPTDDADEARCLDCPSLSADATVVCARERLEFRGEECASAFARVLVWQGDGAPVIAGAWGRCAAREHSGHAWHGTDLLGDNAQEAPDPARMTWWVVGGPAEHLSERAVRGVGR